MDIKNGTSMCSVCVSVCLRVCLRVYMSDEIQQTELPYFFAQKEAKILCVHVFPSWNDVETGGKCWRYQISQGMPYIPRKFGVGIPNFRG